MADAEGKTPNYEESAGDYQMSSSMSAAEKMADEGKINSGGEGRNFAAPNPMGEDNGQSNPQELLEILQDTALRLQKNAKFEQAVKVLVQALHLEIEIYGKTSGTVDDSSTKLIKMCNKLAVKMLKVGKFELCVGFLARALKLTDPSFLPHHDGLRIVTLNNASSCYRRLGDNGKALQYAGDALKVGMAAREDDSLACRSAAS
jgi:tetratricopeptide (TPR) repeat protein